MTHVSLFTGIGGADLAAEWAGFETVLQVEREPFALEVLEKHWPDVPRITDVREVHDDERWTEPTVISGGFPCQPFSSAGRRRGADDDRYLWPELLRIVEELRPTWIVGENVSGLLSIREGMEIDDMLASLEARNYTPWILHYPAAGVGAPHKRDRVFIVAYRKGERNNEQRHEQLRPAKIQILARRSDSDVADTNGLRMEREGPEQQTAGISGKGEDVANTEHGGRDRRPGELRARRRGESTHGGDVPGAESEQMGCAGQSRESAGGDAERELESRMGGMVDGLSGWSHEPNIPRVATGVNNRVDRLKALGNAIVPQQIYPIFEAIARVEACI